MTDFSDMYGNPIDIGDVVLSDSYGGGFSPEPVVIYAMTAKMIKVISMWNFTGRDGKSWQRGTDKMVKPDNVVKYPFELLMGENRIKIEQTFKHLANEGIFL